MKQLKPRKQERPIRTIATEKLEQVRGGSDLVVVANVAIKSLGPRV